jgi:hypothetical protein
LFLRLADLCVRYTHTHTHTHTLRSYWGLNSGPFTCSVSSLPLEPCPSPCFSFAWAHVFAWVDLECGPPIYVPRVAGITGMFRHAWLSGFIAWHGAHWLFAQGWPWTSWLVSNSWVLGLQVEPLCLACFIF